MKELLRSLGGLLLGCLERRGGLADLGCGTLSVDATFSTLKLLSSVCASCAYCVDQKAPFAETVSPAAPFWTSRRSASFGGTGGALDGITFDDPEEIPVKLTTVLQCAKPSKDSHANHGTWNFSDLQCKISISAPSLSLSTLKSNRVFLQKASNKASQMRYVTGIRSYARSSKDLKHFHMQKIAKKTSQCVKKYQLCRLQQKAKLV